jgi:hypothetical protein
MDFEVVGDIREIETIAWGKGIRSRARLAKRYGLGHWRKCKGKAQIKLRSGALAEAELHWYEAHGIGRRGLKIKRFL